MLTLHGFGNNFGLVDPSPFVLKIDTFLRMSAIEYQFNSDRDNLKNAPKGKLPYIKNGDKLISDSQSIIDYLKEEYGDKLDSRLTQEQKALSYLIAKSLDENLYFCLVYSRWLCDDTWPTIKQAFFWFFATRH